MILQLQGKEGFLFQAPHPVLPTSGFLKALMRSQQRGRVPAGMPGAPPPRPKEKVAIGFSFYFRNSKKLTLELRLKARFQSRSGNTLFKVQTFHQRFQLPAGDWKRKPFYYKDFLPFPTRQEKTQSLVRPEPFGITSIAFWEVPAQAPAPTAPASQATSRPASQPTSRPLRKPVRRPVVQAASRPTSRPVSRQVVSQATRPKLDKGVARGAGKGLSVSTSVTLTIQGPFRIVQSAGAQTPPTKRKFRPSPSR